MCSSDLKVAVLEGDAIGPEIMRQAIRVFSVLEQHRDVAFELTHAPFGAQAYFDHGKAFPDDTKTICDNADAILKGPVGLSFEASKAIPVEEQAERGAILPLRARFETFANFRPIYLSKDPCNLFFLQSYRQSIYFLETLDQNRVQYFLLQNFHLIRFSPQKDP